VDAADVITVYSTNDDMLLWRLRIGDSIMSVGITPIGVVDRDLLVQQDPLDQPVLPVLLVLLVLF
jgi:hypothetical protein